ncbi:MAG: DUF1592 domain-containing protein [Pirellulaceae bacterium]
MADVVRYILLGCCLTSAPLVAVASEVTPFLEQHCFDCHNDSTKEGGLDLTSINIQSDGLSDVGLLAKWVRIYDRVRTGEMPPASTERPPASELSSFLRQTAETLNAAHLKQKGTVLRRLNRHEYERTLNALLGTNVQVADLLPDDGRAHGFDTIGEALDLSPVQIQRYMEAAGIALDACVNFGPAPESSLQSLTFDTGRNERNIGKSWIKRSDGAVAVVTECCSAVKVYELQIRHSANYRVKLHVSAHQSDEPIVYRVHAGRDFFDSMPLLNVYEAQPGDAQINEFLVPLRPQETIRLWPELPKYWLKDTEIPKYTGPGIALHKLEVEGPLYAEWPSRGHKLRFGDIPAEDTGPKHQRDKSWYRPAYRLVSSTPEEDLRRVLLPFLEAAFRRPATDEIAEPFIAIGIAELADGVRLDDALRTAQIAALCSIDFLYLLEPEGTLDGFALASRLSYMLWGLPPDTELLSLAANQQLTQSETLRAQTERLLSDPRADYFSRNFTDQWLNLREIDFTTPDKQLYPEYDTLLRHSMLQETRLFFDEMLQNNRPVTEFLDSNWTYLNEPLAKHYRIDGVDGVAMRRVSLRPEHHRGGILTHAAVLKVSANGTTTSPVMRGAFVLDRILGVEPPPPPPGVPGVEPDIRGATTLREQLEKHRSLESCNACHRVLDPPGFALENYDVMGGWRENYRSLGKSFPKPSDELTGGSNVSWRVGPPVDASGETAAGKPFNNLDDYKQILLSQPQNFVRALATKLATYGSGRGMGFSDRPELNRIVQRVSQRTGGLRDLVHEVVQSDLFRSK